MSPATTTLRAELDRSARPRRARRPVLLLGATGLVVVALAGPVVFLLVEASGAGWASVAGLLFRSLSLSLLWNTVRLTVVVTALCALIGTLAAYLVERTDLPGRRVFGALLVIPFAIPDFVVSFGWTSIATRARTWSVPRPFS